VFPPSARGQGSGGFVVFADGFAGAFKDPGRAAFRPSGLAVAPDGALYISDDVDGRSCRVPTKGGAGPAESPPALAPAAASASSGPVLPPEGIHPNAGAEEAS